MAIYWTKKAWPRQHRGTTTVVPAGTEVRIELRDEAQSALEAGYIQREKPKLDFTKDPASVDPMRSKKTPTDSPKQRAEIERVARIVGMPYEGVAPKFRKMIADGMSIEDASFEVRREARMLSREEAVESFARGYPDTPIEECDAALSAVMEKYGVPMATAQDLLSLAWDIDRDVEDVKAELDALVANGVRTPQDAACIIRQGAKVETPVDDAEGPEIEDIAPHVGGAVLCEVGGETLRGRIIAMNLPTIRVKVDEDDEEYREFNISDVEILPDSESY